MAPPEMIAILLQISLHSVTSYQSHKNSSYTHQYEVSIRIAEYKLFLQFLLLFVLRKSLKLIRFKQFTASEFSILTHLRPDLTNTQLYKMCQQINRNKAQKRI